MKLLEFVFSSFPHFIGFLLLLAVALNGLSEIAASLRGRK